MNIASGGEATQQVHASDLQPGLAETPAVVEPRAPVPPPDRDLQERIARAREEAAQAPRRNRFLAFITSRRLAALVIVSLLVYLCFEIPHLFWATAPELPFKIAVVDKTVPFPDRREHKSIFWILIQNKFVDPDKPAQSRWYDYKTDYTGFYPSDAPDHGVGTFLTPESLADRDLLYFSDTYGVYAADYTQFTGDIASTIHSPQIFGGITPDEATATEGFAQQGKSIVAEFNTFASPTPPDVRQRFEKLLGVTWTGWIGRYFVDFRDEKDVPHWLYELYEKQYKKKWDVTGSGYMLCRNESEDFIILHDGADVNASGMEFVPQRAYTDKNVMQGVKPCTFRYWFDVVAAAPSSEVLAQFQFNLTEAGRKQLTDHGLSPIFPAICRHTITNTGGHDGVTYYISGEMVDFNRALGPPDTRLSLYVNRSFFAHAQASSENFFYWHTAYPLETNILRSECKRMTGKPDNVYLFK